MGRHRRHCSNRGDKGDRKGIRIGPSYKARGLGGPLRALQGPGEGRTHLLVHRGSDPGLGSANCLLR